MLVTVAAALLAGGATAARAVNGADESGNTAYRFAVQVRVGDHEAGCSGAGRDHRAGQR